MSNQTRPNSHAIVLGASMAGLLTARVLSEHFDRVTLLERDAVADRPEARKGQPQTRHLHGLLASGLEIMTRYYPDLMVALEEGGALVSDFGESMRWYTYGGYRQRFAMGVKSALMSRPFLEYLIRTRTVARENIALVNNCAVRKLCVNDDRTRVVGVEVEHRDQDGSVETLTCGARGRLHRARLAHVTVAYRAGLRRTRRERSQGECGLCHPDLPP